MRQTANAVAELDREHAEMGKLSTRIAAVAPGPDRTMLVHELCARFVIHAQAEERYLHPAVRRILRDGESRAAEEECRDLAVARTIERVERTKAQTEEFDALVDGLVAGVRDHVRKQDTELLPDLVETCSGEEIDRLSGQLHAGIPAARQAAERAGLRSADAVVAGVAGDSGEPADGGTPGSGFQVLLRWIACGPAAESAG